MPAASDNKFPKVILEERATDGSDTSNPAADHRAMFLGEDGGLHLRDSSGTVTDVSSGAIDWGETGDITDQDYDDVADAGVLNEAARADHLHGMPSAGGGGPGTLLAYVYDTASGNVNITSTTLVDVDATNAITASFTAPASGHVICRIVGTGTTSGDINSFVGVRESTSILGSKVFAMNSQFLRDEQFSVVVDLTGLSAGSHTFKIAACINSGTMTIRSSATNPLSMEVIQGA